MSAESQHHGIGARGAELVRLMCDEPRRPSAELQAWLDASPGAREELEAAQELMRAARDVLTPEPLPAALRDRISRELDAVSVPSRRWQIRPFQFGVAAAAACMLAALLVPTGSREVTQVPEPADASMAMTAEEAAVLVESALALSWDGPELTVNLLSSRVEQVSDDLRGEQAVRNLPWEAGENWDMPAVEPEASGMRYGGSAEVARGPQFWVRGSSDWVEGCSC